MPKSRNKVCLKAHKCNYNIMEMTSQWVTFTIEFFWRWRKSHMEWMSVYKKSHHLSSICWILSGTAFFITWCCIHEVYGKPQLLLKAITSLTFRIVDQSRLRKSESLKFIVCSFLFLLHPGKGRDAKENLRMRLMKSRESLASVETRKCEQMIWAPL